MRTFLHYLLAFLFLSLIQACCDCDDELTDEKITRALVGTWERSDCFYPYSGGFHDRYSFPYGKITFRADGSLVIDSFSDECRDSCGVDTILPDGFIQRYCTCSWTVSNGKLALSGSPLDGYVRNYPVVCIEGGERFVLGKIEEQGHTEERACFERQ